MNFDLFFHLSASLLFLAIFFSFLRRFGYKTYRLLTPHRILFGGTFLSAFLLFLPFCLEQFDRLSGFSRYFGGIMIALHNAIRLFVIDNDFSVILDGIPEAADYLNIGYTILGSTLYILAPLLTFGFILSFFKNMASYRRYFFSYGRTVHVFPSLNERSMALAESIAAATERSGVRRFLRDVIVFTDVMDAESGEYYELIEKTRPLGAIVFHKDLDSIKLNRRFFYRHSIFNFYLTEENEGKKIRYASAVIKELGIK